MKTKKTIGLEQADSIEHELAQLTEVVARMLREPASRRSPDRLEHAWLEIDRRRPRMVAAARSLRKIKKPPRNWRTIRERKTRMGYAAERDMYDRARRFLRRYREWDEVERIVRRHVNPEKSPLLPTAEVSDRDIMLAHIYWALHRLANPLSQDPAADETGCNADIAFPILTFDQLMSAAYRVSLALDPQRSPRFLDVGCGGGTKIIAARRYFRQADGLEYDPGYADAARKMLETTGNLDCRIFHADAREFEAYADFDVIYFFRPMRTDALMDEMERRILAKARPGTILVAPNDASLTARSDMDCANVEGPICVTGIDQAEADQLRDDARATGTKILSRSSERAFDLGYWAPIIDAASFGGSG